VDRKGARVQSSGTVEVALLSGTHPGALLSLVMIRVESRAGRWLPSVMTMAGEALVRPLNGVALSVVWLVVGASTRKLPRKCGGA
jgi:hypothetical protein